MLQKTNKCSIIALEVNFIMRDYEAAINENVILDVYFFSKKKFLGHKKINCFDLCEAKELFLKSYMVVLVTELESKYILLNELEAFCKKYNNYGPIVKMSGNEVIYFPQLRYQDGFLIKNILENNIRNEKFDVMFGSVIV